MENMLYYGRLYDVYKNILTDRQRSIFEDYFFENLTLEEIAENDGVTKSSVAKTIKQIKENLEGLEVKLHFCEYYDSLKKEFDGEDDILNRIVKYDKMVL